MGTVVDRNTLKAMIMEILSKDKELCKDVLDEIVKENSEVKDKLLDDRQARLEKIIEEDFAEYDAVFRALA